jgi:hypothetical protein
MHLGSAPLQRNIAVGQTRAGHRRARAWAACHIRWSACIVFDEQTNNAIVAYFIMEGPNP